MMENDLYLVYVKPFTINNNNTYEYDLFFSETPDVVWGYDWEINNPSICTDLTPDTSTYSKTVRIRVPFPLKTMEETSCYSMEYAIANIVALAFTDIENMEEYPPEGRLVLKFGESYEVVKEKLNHFNILF